MFCLNTDAVHFVERTWSWGHWMVSTAQSLPMASRRSQKGGVEVLKVLFFLQQNQINYPGSSKLVYRIGLCTLNDDDI